MSWLTFWKAAPSPARKSNDRGKIVCSLGSDEEAVRLSSPGFGVLFRSASTSAIRRDQPAEDMVALGLACEVDLLGRCALTRRGDFGAWPATRISSRAAKSRGAK